MREDIKAVILETLQEKGVQSTAQLQRAVYESGLPRSNHRYSVLRNHYLECMRLERLVRLEGEQPWPGGGGGLWKARSLSD